MRLHPEDIKAIAVAIVDEQEARNPYPLVMTTEEVIEVLRCGKTYFWETASKELHRIGRGNGTRWSGTSVRNLIEGE